MVEQIAYDELDFTAIQVADHSDASVYGLQLGLPEGEEDRYRVEAVRHCRGDYGIETQQRLSLADYPSQMEAEDHLQTLAEELDKRGLAVLPIDDIKVQPLDYSSGYLVASFPPDAAITGERANVMLLAFQETGIQGACLGEDLEPTFAVRLVEQLETAQAEGGVMHLIRQAAEVAHLPSGQNLFAPETTRLLDQPIPLESEWGWQDNQFLVIPTENTFQVALAETYHDVLRGDVAGSYLTLGEYSTLNEAQTQRAQLELEAFEACDSSAEWRRFAENQLGNPQWHSFESQHYALLDTASPSWAADLPEVKIKETAMNHDWETVLNEHVTYIPPHVTAEYQSPVGSDWEAPLRIHPQGDPSPYEFEVSAPDSEGEVTLAVNKIVDEERESVILKTYSPEMEFNPRGEALADARALIYEWGRHDLEDAMGSALQLAQTQGYMEDKLFEGDHFTPSTEARPLADIRAEMSLERDHELSQLFLFPDHEDTQPLPLISLDHRRMVGESAYDFPIEAGLAYGFQSRSIPELDVQKYGAEALAVEAVKTWAEEGQKQEELVTLGIYYNREEAHKEVDALADLAENEGIQTAMTRAAIVADAQDNPSLQARAEELDLHLNTDIRYGELFTQGPPDPFMSERELIHIGQQYEIDFPPQHELTLHVVPNDTGHAVLAVDSQWAHEDTQRDPAEATQMTAYEVAQFEKKADADFYTTSLHEYFYKRDLAIEGENIQPALEFVKGLNEVHGVEPRTLDPATDWIQLDPQVPAPDFEV